MSIVVRRLTAAEVDQKISEIATLRINIFKEFPYSYEGSMDYEVKYLSRYLKASNAAFFCAFFAEPDKAEVLVGVATCLPLSEEEGFVQKPYLDAGYDVKEVFYFGESVLLPEYRGQGLGRKFFAAREKFARSFPSTKYTSFCEVQRTGNHHLRPENYKPLNTFWASLGYQKKTKLISHFEWLDIGATKESKKEMIHWMKTWKQEKS